MGRKLKFGERNLLGALMGTERAPSDLNNRTVNHSFVQRKAPFPLLKGHLYEMFGGMWP